MDWILLIISMIIALAAQLNVRSTYKKYSSVLNSRGITGFDAARRILDDSGLYHIRIERIGGELTDHYDPKAEVLRLSQNVYSGSSIAAVGVAAHEAGHALQHAEQYGPIKARNAIVPVAQIGSSGSWLLIMLGLIFGSVGLIDVGIILFGAVVVFQLVTLPVEFNASSRAMACITQSGMLEADEADKSKKVLNAAALTYVAALATSILQLVRLLMIRGRR